MPSVPAHTSKIGYFKDTQTMNYSWGPSSDSFGNLSVKGTRTITVAISNKSPITNSDGVKATTYFRKVGRLTSLVEPRVETSSHKYEASSSIGYRGLTLYESPYGSSYASAATSVPQWMSDKVIQDCVSELNDVRALIMEDFFDAQKTLDSAIGIFNLIVKLFVIAWKRDWRRLRKLLRAMGYDPGRKVANGWLMYYYGIRPLVSSINAALDTYKPKAKLAKATKTVEEPLDPSQFVDWSISTVATGGKAFRLAKCGLSVNMKMSSTVNAWNSFGFTGNDQDAAIVLWAITPYSFVVDWILPVERFLSTRRWSAGIDYQTGYITRVLFCDATVVETNPMTGSSDRGRLPKAKVGCMQFTRTAYNHFTPPSGLTLDWSLNSTQLVNALALIVQRS